MEEKPGQKPVASGSRKKPYSLPTLMKYGKLEQLTLQTGGIPGFTFQGATGFFDE